MQKIRRNVLWLKFTSTPVPDEIQWAITTFPPYFLAHLPTLSIVAAEERHESPVTITTRKQQSAWIHSPGCECETNFDTMNERSWMLGGSTWRLETRPTHCGNGARLESWEACLDLCNVSIQATSLIPSMYSFFFSTTMSFASKAFLAPNIRNTRVPI